MASARSPAASTRRGRRRSRMSGRPAWTRARAANTSSCRRATRSKAPDGYIALPSQTYAGFALLRSNLKSGSDADIAKAVAYGKRVKFYPLSQAANPPRDEVRRCDRRRVRQHHPLRPALLPDARPLRAARAVARARQGHDRFAQDDRHREGQAVQPGCEDAEDSQRCRARSACLARSTSTRASSRRRSTRARTGHCPPSPEVLEGHDDEFRRPRRLSRGRPRRRVFDGVFQRQASGRRASSI